MNRQNALVIAIGLALSTPGCGLPVAPEEDTPSPALPVGALAQASGGCKAIQTFTGTSPSNSEPEKSHIVSCPPGLRLVGGGARVVGDAHHVALVSSYPYGPTTWNAKAREIGAGTTLDWSLQIQVVCATFPVVEVKVEPPWSDDPVKTILATCPLMYNVIGGGAEIIGNSNLGLTSLGPEGTTGWRVSAREVGAGHPTPWAVYAVAYCAPKPVRVVSNWTLTDSTESKTLTARCGPTDQASGGGAMIRGQQAETVLSGSMMISLDEWHTAAHEVDSGNPDGWALQTDVICASVCSE